MIIAFSGKIGSGKDLAGKITQAIINKPTTFEGMEVITEEDIDYKVWDKPRFEIKKFADVLKNIVCLLINCTREQLEDSEFKEKELGEEWWVHYVQPNIGYGIKLMYYSGAENEKHLKIHKLTPRKLLQLIGTECGRNIIHPNIWVNALMSEYHCIGKEGDSSYNKCSNWIITDMRFPNELKAIEDRQGITIRIERPKPSCGDVNFTGTQEEWDALVVKNNIANAKHTHPSETSLDNAKFDHVIYNSGTIKDLVYMIKDILILNKLI